MIFDTDVLIWYFRGREKAAKLINTTNERMISIVTYMELLQGARDKRELQFIRKFLKDYSFHTIPVSENISSRASIYMEEYCLKIDMSVPDALIAATATENQLTLITGNVKHFNIISELMIKKFRPE